MARIENDNIGNQSFHYISIVDSKFREATTTDNPKAVKRTDKNGNEKFELVFSAIEGYITEINFTVNDYGENCEVLLEDKDEKSLIQINSKSHIFRSFAKRLPNLDPKLTTKISVFTGKNGYAAISVRQNDKTIDDAFKQDDNFPEGAIIPGETRKNFHAQKEYLKEKAVEVFMKKLGDWKPTFEVVHPADPSVPAPVAKEEPLPNIGDEDLPF